MRKKRPVVLLLLLYHIKHAHLWLRPLITAVFPEAVTGCQGLWSSLCRRSTQMTPSFLGPPLHISLFPSLKCLSNFLVWEKTQLNQNSSLLSLRGRRTGGELRASRRRVCRAESEKRDLNVFEQSPGLISDTNRATGKLCRAEGGESEGGEGERQMDRHAEEERDRQLTGLLRRNLVDRCL